MRTTLNSRAPARRIRWSAAAGSFSSVAGCTVVLIFAATVALLVGPILAAGTVDVAERRANDSSIGGCLLSLIEEAEVPAQESGVISELLVREGTSIRKGDVLGRVNDRVPQLQKKLAEAEYRSARERSENDINVRYAAAAAKVAEATYLAALDANSRVKDAIGRNEVRRLELESTRAKLQIEQAQMEQKVLMHDLTGKAAELEAAADAIRRRHITAPFDGVVIEMRRHVGEWVNPGQTVLRMIRMDRLWVEGFVSASKFEPGELTGRPVTIDVELARGRRQSVSGRIVFVNPIVQAGGEFRVRAEVENIQQNGRWSLQPGLSARMNID